MNTTTCRLLSSMILVSSVSLGTAALADDTAMHHDKGEKAMSMMDTDHDGQISSAEHAAAAQKMFTQADTNKDGKVTADELQAAHKARMEKHDAMSADKDADTHKDMKAHRDIASSDWFKSMDANGDGALSSTEHAAGMQAMFKKMDTNSDGKVSADEMKAGHKSMAARNEE